MGFQLRPFRTSWKRIAFFNAICIGVLLIFLSVVLIITYNRTGHLDAAVNLYRGPCSQSKTINLLLHLLLNILGTLILASSNFFMQILNAPTRADLDCAHARSSWVNVGVPSLRNLVHLGPLRFLCWLILACSSVPLHLFFNSLVYEVTETQSKFWLTIATESFLHGADYYAPGAGLWNTAVPYNCSLRLSTDYEEHGYLCANATSVFMFDGVPWAANWMNETSDERTSISRAAASLNDSQWERLDIASCRSQFLYANGGLGLKNYKNVVMVVSDPFDEPLGWRRDHVFPNMTDEDAAFWDDMVPSNRTSSLWHHESCETISTFDNGKSTNSCKINLGFSRLWYRDMNTVDPRNDTKEGTWKFPFFEPAAVDLGMLTAQMRSGFDQAYSDLAVEYCMAEKTEQMCKVGLSIYLLFAVMVCVAVKTVQCIFILLWFVMRKHHPLVTLGDAIDSLLRRSDPTTSRMCTLQVSDIQTKFGKFFKAIRAPRKYDSAFNRQLLSPAARQWNNQPTCYFSALPWTSWLRAYALFLTVVGVALYYYSLATDGRFNTSGIFGISGMNKFVVQNKASSDEFRGDFLHVVLLANIPQLVLSVAYIQLNTILTKLCMAREWARMGVAYRPLRVTEPRGEQTSTYRLQMPYSWGIPCIISAILVHWLASNACYVFMADGGFYGSPTGTPVMSVNRMGFSGYGFVAMGYSTTAIVASIAVFAAVICVPLVFSAKRMPSNMVIVGSNSLAIAAACHGSVVSKAKDSGQVAEAGQVSSYSTVPGSDDNLVLSPNEAKESASTSMLASVAESKVKWGIVAMPLEFYQDLNNDIEAPGIQHLSFGVEANNVTAPVPGGWYA
ncbi:hypothetical protein B0T10DRAFT_552213 [Thelonectria olida]|uniref:DUF6536 domain-containing protein n=1 Tax=Thelonectria olida TaxID=1576542 RepID=A0A9P8VTB9_9HYPO|nr:hypothetical protein B0T10DRAFT_552213 [Thelonectria olida]